MSGPLEGDKLSAGMHTCGKEDGRNGPFGDRVADHVPCVYAVLMKSSSLLTRDVLHGELMLARYPQLTCQAKACFSRLGQVTMQIKKARELLFTLSMLIRPEGASNRLIGTGYGKLLCRIYLLYGMYLLKLTGSLFHQQVTYT